MSTLRFTRRGLLAGGAAVLLAGPVAATGRFEIMLSDEEWRRRLTPAQFAVLRKHDTEPPGSSPLDREWRRGTYHCAGCDLAVYASADKFDSGTGWPSFTRSLRGAVGRQVDRRLIFKRIEVHCRRCGGHLGHVFTDGPPPTGERHCINGVALRFRPA